MFSLCLAIILLFGGLWLLYLFVELMIPKIHQFILFLKKNKYGKRISDFWEKGYIQAVFLILVFTAIIWSILYGK